MTGLEVLSRELASADQWRLNGGRGADWSPADPRWLDRPGFRDPATYNGQAIEPVFAVTLLDEHARAIPARAEERNWTPARLELKYRLCHALATERRCILSSDTFVSHWKLTHASETPQRYWLVLWTRRPNGLSGRRIHDVEANPRGISFQESAIDPKGNEAARWGCALGASFDADSWSVTGVESIAPNVEWESTPFYELIAPGGLPGHHPPRDGASGHLYFALAYPFEVPPGERLVVTFAASFAADVEQARNNLERGAALIDPIHVAEEEWIAWFEDVPGFSCSDPYLQRAYWHRWAARRWEGGTASSSEQDDAEPPALSNQTPEQLAARVFETSWRQSADHAVLAFRALLAKPQEEMLSAPLAHVARRLLSLYPSRRWKRLLARRASAALDRSEQDKSGVRFESFPAPWNLHPLEKTRPSLRKSVFALDLFELLDWIEPAAGNDPDSWKASAQKLSEAIDATFWDGDDEFYCERLPNCKGQRVARTANGFLPLLVDLVDSSRRRAIVDALADPEFFWTTYAIPSLARSDPDFNPDGHWENLRLDRPMHGRVWPELNSLVIDAIGKNAETLRPSERLMLAELIRVTAMLMFVDGDLNRPASREHYHPLTGRSSPNTKADSPASGWLIDHLLRYLVGARPDENGNVLIDPLPFRLDWFSVNRLFIGDHEFDIQWDHRVGLTVRIDDALAGQAPVGQALSLTLPQPWEVE